MEYFQISVSAVEKKLTLLNSVNLSFYNSLHIVRNQTDYPVGSFSETYNGNHMAVEAADGIVIDSSNRMIAGRSGQSSGNAIWYSITLAEEVLIKNVRVITYPSSVSAWFNEVNFTRKRHLK